MDKEFAAVAGAPEGSRNVILNTAAYNMGQLVGAGWIKIGEVRTGLQFAAERAGMPAGEASRTINSGLEAGMSADRTQQWRKR
jgi:hypothetical protein